MASLPSSLRFPFVLSLMMLAASSGCSGSVDPAENEGDGDGDGMPPVGDGDGDGTSQGCQFGGVEYEPGDSIPGDGCNSCYCNGASVICTDIYCGDGDGSDPPTTCEFGGVVYQSGESFESDCNTCGCSDGTVSCTLIDCAEPDDQCTLPFEGGDCDAAFPVYWHNPDTGNCEPKTYGGCGGNENRFDTQQECAAACGGEPAGRSCEVNGVVYPDGSSDVPDPTSCNTCSCSNGVVGGCTEIGCPIECEEGSEFGSECAECGPTDACLSVRTGCLPTCEIHEDCAEVGGGVCLDNLCKSACG